MRDISLKASSKRIAEAKISLRMSKNLLEILKNKQVPKGDVLEISKAVGFNAAKFTSTLLPFCHPILLEYMKVEYEFKDYGLDVLVCLKTIAKTGVEMEALTASSIIAVNIYDMLKPFGEDIEITDLKLLSKQGGKSSFDFDLNCENIQARIIIVSDSLSKGEGQDKSSTIIINKLQEYNISNIDYEVIPDEKLEIEKCLNRAVENNIELIFTSGSTGLSKRDILPEFMETYIDREIPGLNEYLRIEGQGHNPYAIFSRAISGQKKNSLIISLPGSSSAVKEAMELLIPNIFHILEQMNQESSRLLNAHK